MICLYTDWKPKMAWFSRTHDALSRLSGMLGAICLGLIAVFYCGEIISRYFLNAPSSWTAAVSIYLMLVTVMLMLPALAMTNDHVAVTITDLFPPLLARWMVTMALAVASAVCFFSAYFTYEETLRAFSRGVRTTDTLFIPKWWLLAFVVYGLLSTAIHLLRHFLTSLRGHVPAESSRA